MDSLSLFQEPVGRWFAEQVGQPTAVQAEGWPVIASGGHALVSAPTGTGKTLAAFLVFIDRLSALAAKGELEDRLYVLYISPLKALGNDIGKNLRRPLDGIPCPDIRVAIRNGDTEPSERRQMLKRPPHILITTPESLFLLLSSKSGQDMLRPAQTVIIDEMHALIDTKRGAHLMLSLARLDALRGCPLQRVALSATIRPLKLAADYLAAPAPARIVAPGIRKESDIRVVSVVPDMRALPEGTVWPELYRAVYERCQGARSVIAFVEGRQQAEKLAHGVNEIAGEGFARTHHGCVSKEQRHEAEAQLKRGELRLLCATSSMELGIDVGEIDVALQIGCPMTVSGALQRLGRAGHNPGRVSEMRMFPRMTSEMVFCGMTATAALNGDIEPARPPVNCLDVVAQHVVSMAAMGVYTVDELHRIICSAHSFRDVTREQLTGVLRMLAGDFEHEQDRPARARILYDRIYETVGGDNYSRMLAVTSGGTIPDMGWFPVTLEDGTRLGELDEVFVYEARLGDRFLLGAFAWRVLEIRRDRVIVAPASTAGARAPFWKGDGHGRAYEIGLKFGEYLRSLQNAHLAGRLVSALRALSLDEAAALNAQRHLVRQISICGCLPDDRTILLEHFRDQAGEHQLMVHSVFGRRVNTGLELLMQRAASRQIGLDVQSFSDDDGFLLYLSGEREIPDGLMDALNPDTAEALLRAMLPATPLFTMLFRYNAMRALMMGVRKGGRVPLWVQRMRGAEALDGAIGQPDHPIIWETVRECMEDYLDLRAIREVLEGVRSGAIAVHEFHTDDPSPMALPLRRQAESVMMYEYGPVVPSSARQASADALSAQERIPPEKQQLELASERGGQPRDAERLHQLLMAEGDIVAGEVDAPIEWLEALARKERALYIEPGLWIAAEQARLYEEALLEGAFEAQCRVARRCLRYRGPQDADALAERYRWPEGTAARVLAALEAEGAAVEQDGAHYHIELYKRAQRATIAQMRREVRTLEPERYAYLLQVGLRSAGSPMDQLKKAMPLLTDAWYSPDMWENVLLPARVAGYTPRLLDDLLGSGEYFWQAQGDERLTVRFFRHEQIDWDAEPARDAPELSKDERTILAALGRRGASFAHTLTPLLGGRSVLDALTALIGKGLVHADSFVPIRLWAARKRGNLDVKQRSRARVAAQDSGRWEVVRPVTSDAMERRLERAFDRYTLLCRETCGDVRWSEALELLRVWEYTGRVRRGYFIRGLSGAQFIRSADYQRALQLMNNPRGEVVWLNAADPVQPWGKILPHAENAGFLCVQGTAVALSAGKPAAILERQECLRVLDTDKMDEALSALARDFELKRVYPSLQRLTIKECPDGAQSALLSAGFVREMRDYVLWR